MKKIPSTIVLHKHVDGAETRFSTVAGPLENDPLGKCLGVIRRGTYQAAYKDIIWEYEPVSGLWLYIEPNMDSSGGGTRD